MPQTIGGGTVMTGGPGTNLGRGPIYIQSAPGDKGQNTYQQLFDANGVLQGPNGVVVLASFAVSSAEIKTLNSVGKQLLAAPGAGLFYDVESVYLDYTYGTAQYASGGALQLSYGTGTTTPASATVAATFLTSPTGNQLIRAAGALASSLSSAVLNKAITLVAATGDFTTGDGTLVAIVRYRILSGA